MVELCQIACEKFAAAEKTPGERNNFRAAEMIKATKTYCVFKLGSE